MYLTGRKMGFIGMIISLNSLKSIFEDHDSSSEPILKYVLAYKFSQDHLFLVLNVVVEVITITRQPASLKVLINVY